MEGSFGNFHLSPLTWNKFLMLSGIIAQGDSRKLRANQPILVDCQILLSSKTSAYEKWTFLSCLKSSLLGSIMIS